MLLVYQELQNKVVKLREKYDKDDKREDDLV